MKEDIKILEEVIEKYKTNTANILDLDSNDLFKRLILNQEQVQLLENLIKGYRELEEMLKNRIKYTNELEKDLFENASNYVIPKSKIQAKIDELGEWEYNDDFEPNLAVMSDIQLLSELLED